MKTSITVKPLAEQSNVTILDVRKKPAYDEDTVVIAGARWRDPAAGNDWGAEFAGGGPVVCYCVHGHEVSQGASAAPRPTVDRRPGGAYSGPRRSSPATAPTGTQATETPGP